MNDHTLKSYDNELSGLRGILARMGGLAEEQLVLSMKALLERDRDAAQAARDSDALLDDLEHEAENAAMVLFARRAPVADDLREVVAVLKMTTLIERMGDYAKNIARRALIIMEEEPLEIPDLLESMLVEARHMIQGSIDSFVQRDAALAVKIWEHDETLDNLHNSANREIMARMQEQPDHIVSLTHLLMIAKNLERVGDQSTNISEHVYAALTGTRMSGSRPKNDQTSRLMPL